MKVLVLTMLFALAVVSVDGWAASKKIIVPKDMPSIQKALDEANDGDTVYVQSGTYRESVVMKDNVFLIGQDAQNTVIRGNGSKPAVEGANRAVIKNFTIERGSTGILCKNTNPLIEHNIVRDNRTGIHALISLPEIRNNIVYANEWTGIYCELITNSQHTSIDHNFIAENGYSGIMLANKSEVLIQNTVFFNNKQYGIYVNEDSKRSRIIYNCFFGNRSAYNLYAVINETNIAKDPGLKSTGASSFSFENFGGKNYALSGLGKSGADIGPMSDAAIKKMRLDSDNDGIPDDVDVCPDIPEDIDVFHDEDGCPDFDNDNDGIYDAQDKCPNDPEDFDGFQDEDGCSDPDNDGDGIPDKFDKCPNTPEDKEGVADDDGCPDGGKVPAVGAAPAQKPIEPAKANVATPKPAASPQAPAPATKPEVKKAEAPVKK
jgi:OOP family OmpA-OmpF porin